MLLRLCRMTFELCKKCSDSLVVLVMGVGEGGGWILKISAKNGCFLSFEWEKSNFTTFGPPYKKFWKTPSSPLPGKIFPTPLVLLFRFDYPCLSYTSSPLQKVSVFRICGIRSFNLFPTCACFRVKTRPFNRPIHAWRHYHDIIRRRTRSRRFSSCDCCTLSPTATSTATCCSRRTKWRG